MSEVGYNHLDSSYTGTRSSALSGSPLFPFVDDDKGVADTLTSMESRSIEYIG